MIERRISDTLRLCGIHISGSINTVLLEDSRVHSSTGHPLPPYTHTHLGCFYIMTELNIYNEETADTEAVPAWPLIESFPPLGC